MRQILFGFAAWTALALTLACFHDTAWAQAPATAPASEAPALEAAAPDSIRLAPVDQVLQRGGLLRSDRLRHLSLSFALGLGIGVASDSPWAGAGAAGGIGLLKEVDDGRRGGTFDRLDLLADLLGAGLAGIAATALRR